MSGAFKRFNFPLYFFVILTTIDLLAIPITRIAFFLYGGFEITCQLSELIFSGFTLRALPPGVKSP